MGVLSYNDAITYMSNPGSGYPGSGYPGYPSFPNNPATNPSAYSTQVAIIYNDGSWSNAIRSLFVYGSGGLRIWLNVTRGGTAGGRAFVISTTIAADSVSRALQNTINDPNYVREHVTNWQSMWNQQQGQNIATVHVDPATEIRLTNALNTDGLNPASNSSPNNIGNSLSGNGSGSGFGRGNGSGSINNIII